MPYGGSLNDRPGASLPITPENYQSEEERIKSFVGWPLNEVVHPEQLARVGFVYTGEGALVQCFQCGVKYRHWYKGDVPLNVHQKCNPRCPFLQTFASEKRQSPHPKSIGRIVNNKEVGKHLQSFPDNSEQAVLLYSSPSASSMSLPPRMIPTCTSKSLNEAEETIPGIRYPPSWGQPQSSSSDSEDEKVSELSLEFLEHREQAVGLSFKHWDREQKLAEGGFYMMGRRYITDCLDGIRYSVRNEIVPVERKNNNDDRKSSPLSSCDSNGKTCM